MAWSGSSLLWLRSRKRLGASMRGVRFGLQEWGGLARLAREGGIHGEDVALVSLGRGKTSTVLTGPSVLSHRGPK